MAKKISEKAPDKKVRSSHLEEAQQKIQEQIDQLRSDVDALKQGQNDLNAKIASKPATTPVQDAAKNAFDAAMGSGSRQEGI